MSGVKTRSFYDSWLVLITMVYKPGFYAYSVIVDSFVVLQM